jgi:uncharacterized protein
MKKILLVTVIGLLLVLSISACGRFTPVTSTTPPIRSLSATGNGLIYIVPDVAYINIGVRTDSDEVSTALSNNNIQANEVSKALQALGVDAKDIQTSSFNVYPMSDYGPDGQISRKYFVVENTVYITVRDLTKLGELLDAVVRSGANTINGISFDVLDKASALAQARDMAISKAKAEAESIASAAGVKLGSLQSITVNQSGGATPIYDAKGYGGMAPASSVPVSAGQLVITMDANLTYEIK